MIQLNKSKIINKSIPISCDPYILKMMVELDYESYTNGTKTLTSNLIDELTNLFGEQNKTFKLEFITKVWVIDYKNLTFNIFTAKNKGTSIEFVGDIDDMFKYRVAIKQFVIEFKKIINGLI